MSEAVLKYFDDWYRYLARRVSPPLIREAMVHLLPVLTRQTRRSRDHLWCIYLVTYRFLKKNKLLGNTIPLLSPLSPSEQEILRLRYFERLSLEKTAKFFGLKTEETERRLEIALNHLKQSLNPRR